MCILKRHLKRPKKGYKVVVLGAKGQKYSPAMGIAYEDGKPVEIPKVQQRRVILYSDKILNPKAGHGFRESMVGRTAIFKHLLDAISLVRRIGSNYISWSLPPIAIFEATVSVDVMSGIAGSHSTEKVYAGRVITFGDRIG